MTTTDQKAGTPCTARHGSAGTPRRNALAVAGFGVACMLACSLPLLIGGGAAAALGALFSGAGLLAVVLAIVTAGGATWWLGRRRRVRLAAGSSCKC